MKRGGDYLGEISPLKGILNDLNESDKPVYFPLDGPEDKKREKDKKRIKRRILSQPCWVSG